MPKYIDADALIKTESELLEYRGLTNAEKTAHLFALSILTTSKSADVAPVVHGAYSLDEKRLGRCSECGGQISIVWRYCPHCGARMDLKS